MVGANRIAVKTAANKVLIMLLSQKPIRNGASGSSEGWVVTEASNLMMLEGPIGSNVVLTAPPLVYSFKTLSVVSPASLNNAQHGGGLRVLHLDPAGYLVGSKREARSTSRAKLPMA